MSVEQENIEETPVVEEELTEEQRKEQEEYDRVFFGEPESKGTEDEEEEPVDEGEKEEEPKAVEPESDEVPEGEATPETNADEIEEGEENPEQPTVDSKGTHTIKWNGKDVNVSTDELIAMAQQGFDYTYKSQNLAQERRQFQNELSLLERVRGGDKEALAQLSKQSGIDPLDLLDIDTSDVEQGISKPAAPFSVSPQVRELMDQVRKDEGLYGRMQQVEDVLPRSVVDVMAQDAGTFYDIVNEVRSGDAEVVLPEVQKQIALLPEMDRVLVMNNPDQYKNFYLGVKQSMINAMQEQHQLDDKGIVPETKPKTQAKRPNPAEVGVKRSGTGTNRVEEQRADSMSSDKVYHQILERLANQ